MTSKQYQIGFFILLAINIVLVVVFTLRPKPPIAPGGFREVIVKDLNFNEGQKTQFDQMARNHHDAIRDIEEKERRLVEAYFNQLHSQNTGDPDEVVLNEILQMEEAKITVTYSHFEELKSLCSDDQLAKYDQLMGKMIQTLLGEKGTPPSHHPR
ncbi:MAG: hypothetical protein RJQ14_23295 [Marinoscillum sp.]